MSGRAAFLDRDGVLVETLVRGGRPHAAVTLAEFRICPEAPAQVARLKAAGLRPIVFTNQPEVARGTLSPGVLDRMHAELRATVRVDDILVCGHLDGDDCACRKPRPGMLEAAARKWAIDLPASFVVGDRWRDIAAGRAVGCYTVLIERPYSECREVDARVADLASAVDAVLARAKDTQ
ncbi:MAG: D-glycero-alpha-D-manno-heptose-1,7-bisphosphate 7-phosphatase [Thermoleophilaceae bacterium]